MILELLLLEIFFEYLCLVNIIENRYCCFVCLLLFVVICIWGSDVVYCMFLIGEIY